MYGKPRQLDTDITDYLSEIKLEYNDLEKCS